MDAYKCQGKRNDLVWAVQNEIDSGTNWPKVESRDIVAKMNNTSARYVSRYLRLNELIEFLLELVDTDVIPFTAGVALSFLTKEEQQMIVEAIEEGIIKKIDLKSAEELKSISKSRELNKTVINQLFSKRDTSLKPQNNYSIFPNVTKKALKYFKKTDYQGVQINLDELEQILVDAIKNYAENKQ